MAIHKSGANEYLHSNIVNISVGSCVHNTSNLSTWDDGCKNNMSGASVQYNRSGPHKTARDLDIGQNHTAFEH